MIAAGSTGTSSVSAVDEDLSGEPIAIAAGENDSSPAPVGSPVSLLLGRLIAPVDIASLIVFRIGFGGLMVWWAWDYLATGRVRFYYIEPRFHFTYYPFDWIRPWPGPGMYLHFLALLILGLGIACGCCYRLASLIFALGFTYFFLIDATNYQNH